MKQKPKVRTPGEEPKVPESTESDVNAAIEAAQSGEAHKIAKPRPEVAPSKVKGDPSRPADAAVNARREMSYEDAMLALNAETEIKDLQAERIRLREDLAMLGDEPDEKVSRAEVQGRMAAIRKRIEVLSAIPKLKRAVLTEKGWVSPLTIDPPPGMRT
jgi:hypothetical protein